MNDILVYMFTGKKHVSMAKNAISLFQRYAPYRARFNVLSDGTLNKNVFSNLQGEISVISREEQDDLVAPRVSSYRAIQAFRQRDVLARKIIDLPLIAENDAINFIDADVMAMRPHINFLDKYRPLTFNIGGRIAISLGFSSAWKILGSTPIAFKLNSGIFQYDRRLHDLDFIEFALNIDGFSSGIDYLAEQTLWSFIAGRNLDKFQVFNPKKVSVVSSKTNLESMECAVGHFISPARSRLQEISRKKRTLPSLVDVDAFDGCLISKQNLLLDRLRFKFGAG